MALRTAALALALVIAGVATAQAQFGGARGAPTAPLQRDQPVYYQADAANYDREAGIVTLTGHVEFWQNDRMLLADKVTYDRNTDVAAAIGHVVLLEPSGQTVFSDYAELSGGMKNGVMSQMRALLAENGRLAANGARRTDGTINELSRAVYSTCNLCAQDPTRAPLWQIRAREVVQDTENKLIEYRDAVIDLFGIPVLYLPYLTHPDPSEKRASGLLVPTIGYTKHLGAFTAVPYYWVIDPQSDVTLTPIVGTSNGPGLLGNYRRRFNDGSVTVNASIANDKGDLGGHVFAKGQFALDDTFRWGFDINRASSSNYLRDYQIVGRQDVLTSQVYVEGFGEGAYSRLDTRSYQGLSTTVKSEQLPYVLPRYEYSFVSGPDILGGRISVEAGGFNVLRNQGTSTQRASFRTAWERRDVGRLGDVWKFGLHLDSAAYAASQFNEQPNYGSATGVTSAQAMPTASAELHWPLARDAGNWGSQLIEPIAQVLVAPRGSNYVNTKIPNEDALDLEFTDANLFAINRFVGIDRLEGGVRANVALHAAWYFPGGGQLDGLIGQGYRAAKDNIYPAGSGLNQTTTDVVSHQTYTPNGWFDITARERFDHKTWKVNFADAIASAGPSWLRVSGGYFYTPTNPFQLYEFPPTTPNPSVTVPRNEIGAGIATQYGPWKLALSGRRDLQSNQMVASGARASYEDECFIFDINFFRRFTSLNGDHGASTVLFQITLKTVGQFGFHAL